MRPWGLLVIAVLLSLLSACGNSVTGIDPQTKNGTQSETSATTAYVSGKNHIVVAFNDETNEQNYIVYSSADRVVKTGASLMGWAYSDDNGGTWHYGGKLSPPSGWAVLWGDPALTTYGASFGEVFLSNLAVPSKKMPLEGIQGLLYYGDGRTAYIGGACIAKSTDGGVTFASYQCVSNTEPIAGVPDSPLGHFYDGGSMASNSNGEIFAAYVDIAAGQIDVYRSPSDTGSFQRLAQPFPNLVAVSHAKLRIGLDGSLYVAAQMAATNTTGYIYMNRWVNGSWGNPVLVSNLSLLYPLVDFGTTVEGSELTIRTGPQFGYDLGAASAGGNDAMRLLYTQTGTNGHMAIAATACSADLKTCSNVPGWGFQGGGPNGTSVDTFNPDVTAWRGFIGLPPTWQASWAYHYGNTKTISVSRATLGFGSGSPLIIPVDILKNTPACSDQRGYWGDYDAMILVGFAGGGSQWIRFSTDSSAGCSKRWAYVGEQQHIQYSSFSN